MPGMATTSSIAPAQPGPTGHWLGVNLDNLETQDRRALLRLLFTVEPGIYMPAVNFDASPSPKGLGMRSEINCLMHAGAWK